MNLDPVGKSHLLLRVKTRGSGGWRCVLRSWREGRQTSGRPANPPQHTSSTDQPVHTGFCSFSRLLCSRFIWLIEGKKLDFILRVCCRSCVRNQSTVLDIISWDGCRFCSYSRLLCSPFIWLIEGNKLDFILRVCCRSCVRNQSTVLDIIS